MARRQSSLFFCRAPPSLDHVLPRGPWVTAYFCCCRLFTILPAHMLDTALLYVWRRASIIMAHACMQCHRLFQVEKGWQICCCIQQPRIFLIIRAIWATHKFHKREPHPWFYHTIGLVVVRAYLAASGHHVLYSCSSPSELLTRRLRYSASCIK